MDLRSEVPPETICKQCGRALLRGFTICICLLGMYASHGAHNHRDPYLFRPTTEIIVAATTTSSGVPPIQLNGQKYYLK
jgi:hypothetical protein